MSTYYLQHSCYVSTLLLGAVFYLARSSEAVDYSTVSIVWTPQSTKLWKQSVTLHNKLTETQQRHEDMNSCHKTSSQKHCTCRKLSNTQKSTWYSREIDKFTVESHSSFLKTSTLARQHHLVANMGIAACGQFFFFFFFATPKNNIPN